MIYLRKVRNNERIVKFWEVNNSCSDNYRQNWNNLLNIEIQTNKYHFTHSNMTVLFTDFKDLNIRHCINIHTFIQN